MLKKQSNVGIPCTYCEKQAIPDTDPPVCEDCRNLKKKASKEKPLTLKELEALAAKDA